jgi:hypothetical protein
MVWRLDAPYYSSRVLILAGSRTLLRLRSAATVAEIADELDVVYCSQRVVDKAFFSENTVRFSLTETPIPGRPCIPALLLVVTPHRLS